jgi:hypothetical protein
MFAVLIMAGNVAFSGNLSTGNRMPVNFCGRNKIKDRRFSGQDRPQSRSTHRHQRQLIWVSSG